MAGTAHLHSVLRLCVCQASHLATENTENTEKEMIQEIARQCPRREWRRHPGASLREQFSVFSVFSVANSSSPQARDPYVVAASLAVCAPE
jgi:hypothetical protein